MICTFWRLIPLGIFEKWIYQVDCLPLVMMLYRRSNDISIPSRYGHTTNNTQMPINLPMSQSTITTSSSFTHPTYGACGGATAP